MSTETAKVQKPEKQSVRAPLIEGLPLKLKMVGKAITLRRTLTSLAFSRGSELANAADPILERMNAAEIAAETELANARNTVLLGMLEAKANAMEQTVAEFSA